MNGYDLSRNFWDWAFENPDKVKPIHSAIYFFSIEHCNRLGWKEKFGLPSQMVMEAIGVKNWKTYSQALKELIDFGFITMIEKSTNQYSSNIIAIVNFTKAPTKAESKALDKALSKHGTKQGQSTVSIDKQVTIEQVTSNNIPTKSDVSVDEKKELHKSRLKNFDTHCEKMLVFYNKTFGKQSKVVNQKTKDKLKKLLYDYDWADIAKAMSEVRKSKHHAENGFRWATLDFFTRPDKIEMYAFSSEAKPEYQGEDAKLVNYVANYYKS
jgi:hypothetical protein